MINYLNETLRQLFLSKIGEMKDASQVSFEFPDEDFRSQVKTNGKTVLDVCLVELRENRSAAPPAPPSASIANRGGRRVDCHYLVSAWSPASKGVEPTLDEHALLYMALAALMGAEPFTPRHIYGRTPLPANFPRSLLSSPLQTMILPMERYARSGEFWAATHGAHWKPTIHLVVTLPVLLESGA